MTESPGIICNLKGCFKVLRKTAWVTSCSHIFCDEDGLKELRSSGECKCPVCGALLGHSADIVRADLNPPEHFKSMVLAGLSPDIIIDIVGRSILFWSYQASLYRKHQEGLISIYKNRLSLLENSYENVIAKSKHEIHALKKKIDVLEKELKALLERLEDSSAKLAEKNKENQKLHTLCNSIRLANLNSCVDGLPVERTEQSFSLGPKTMTELNPPSLSQSDVRKIAHPQSATAIRRTMIQSGAGFVFNPVTPTGASRQRRTYTTTQLLTPQNKIPKFN